MEQGLKWSKHVSSELLHLLRFVRVKSQEQKLRFAQGHLQAALGLEQ